MVNIIQNLCPSDKYSIKCPYAMTPTRIVIHNTANDAPAKNEIAYMLSNNKKVSFHYAVDDTEIIQGIPLDRNAWHAGDGAGKGNREGIAIEICYSKSGGERFEKAQKNAAELTAKLLKDYGWGIDKVTKHQDYNGKHCPHRTLDQYGWEFFIGLVKSYMVEAPKPVVAPAPAKKSVSTIAQEVIAGKWGNGNDRKKRLTDAGYNYTEIQNAVNALCGKKTSSPAPVKTAPKVNYYPRYFGSSGSIVTALNSLKIGSTFSNRKKIAKANDIKLYAGTAAQNIKMLDLLKKGKLIKP